MKAMHPSSFPGPVEGNFNVKNLQGLTSECAGLLREREKLTGWKSEREKMAFERREGTGKD